MHTDYRKILQRLNVRISQPFTGNQSSGMTLIEIIIVVALLGTLMAYLVQTLTTTADHAKEDQVKLAMGNITQSLMLYRVHNHSYPTSDKGLDALMNNPGDSKTWRGPYIEKEKLQDPWGKEFHYESDGKVYKIISGGIDETFDTPDDLTYPAAADAAGGAAKE
jgi:general secretion pathway protein G